jgi:NRAMP (natural resistance-associated macrophage protein)-like metal ion transporter
VPRRHPVGRHVHERVRARRRRVRLGGLAALLAVVGPGVLAGLSDDDPPGITTYSKLGADYGYELIWVVVLSTIALIVFHEVAVRTGVVTGKGLMTLVHERYGPRTAAAVVAALVVANFGTLCAEFAGLAAGAHLLTGVGRGIAIPIACLAVGLLVLRGSFHRVEHVLLALSSVFVTYIIAGFLAGPDWGEAAKGAVVPSLPGGRETILVIVATVGTTLAPWGLAFIQSYAVDKRLTPRDLRYERVDVVTGAVMTGVIAIFVVVACAATLNSEGVSISNAGDAARALEPLAGAAASDLFAVGFIGAALLAIAIVPLSTAYSMAESRGRPADLDDRFSEARLFYVGYGVVLVLAAALVALPGVPIVPLLYLSQALNAILLLAILPFIRRLAMDPDMMGEHRLGPAARVATAATIFLVAGSVLVLGWLTVA